MQDLIQAVFNIIKPNPMTQRVKRKHLFYWSCFLHFNSVKSSSPDREYWQEETTQKSSQTKPCHISLCSREETGPRTTQGIAKTAALIFKTYLNYLNLFVGRSCEWKSKFSVDYYVEQNILKKMRKQSCYVFTSYN